jgi:hypothetical protein
VDVCGVAIIRRTHRDDGLEGGRLARRDLQPVEAAPRDADHGDLAVAPVLAGDPRDGVAAVELFLNRVFVVDQAFAVAGAANVEADRGIAMAGQIVVQTLVARSGAITLAVGEIFENGGHRACALGEPAARRKPGAVRQRNEEILHHPHGKRKLGAHSDHRRPLLLYVCIKGPDRPSTAMLVMKISAKEINP